MSLSDINNEYSGHRPVERGTVIRLCVIWLVNGWDAMKLESAEDNDDDTTDVIVMDARPYAMLSGAYGQMPDNRYSPPALRRQAKGSKLAERFFLTMVAS